MRASQHFRLWRGTLPSPTKRGATLPQVPTLGESGLGGSPQQFADYLRAEQAKWSKVVREANVKLD